MQISKNLHTVFPYVRPSVVVRTAQPAQGKNPVGPFTGPILRTLYRRLICSLFACMITLSGYCQAQKQLTLKGVVQNTSGTPIPYATVGLKGTDYGTVCDGEGAFRLKVVPGNYVLLVSHIGYKVYQLPLKLTVNDNTPLNIELQKSDIDLNEVTVTGKNQTQELKESGFAVNAIETKAFQNTTANLNQVLDQTSGIRVRQSGGLGSNINFSINGLSGNAVKYFIDGVPLEAMGDIMNLNNIPVNLAKSVEIYKGVVPIEFGADAMGGVVNLVTNGSQKSYIDASFSTGSFATQQAAVSTQYADKNSGFVVKASGFMNYSRNNYIMKDVEVFDASLNRYVLQDHRRFHDHYFSAMGMIEAGFTNKKWADLFMIGGSYSKQNNDLQNGTTQNILYGNAERKAKAFSANIKYKKDDLLIKNLNANLFASYTKNNFSVIDTTFRLYFWDGSYTVTNRAEISGGARSIRQFDRPTVTTRANLNYSLSDQHAFSLNYQLNYSSNNSYDELNIDESTKAHMTKHILGFAYQQSLLKSRLSNTFFAKYYGIGLKTEETIDNQYMTGDVANANGYSSSWGYGLASRFKLTQNTGIKASYEYTYRLQEPEELLGNGYSVMANYDLKPESSRNYNLGFYLGNNNPRHRIFFEGSGFYRNAGNYIQGIFREALAMTQYQNTSSVKIKGVEAEARYTFKQLLNVNLNASYQNAVNATITDGNKEVTYGYKLPNRPWVFGNASANIGKNDLFGKDTRIQFGYSFQYIHWFYLTWANFGNPDNKSSIPSQYIHNILLSYSLKNSKYNLSFECKNLTDNLAYDNFKLQKPGRSFFVKLRVFLAN